MLMFTFFLISATAAGVLTSSAGQLQAMITRHSKDVAQIMEDTKTLLHQHEAILEAINSSPPATSTMESSTRVTRSSSSSTALSRDEYPRDCYEIKSQGQMVSGLYTVYVTAESGFSKPYPITVYCDMITESGAWITFLRRSDKNGNFPTRTWEEYKYFFGMPLGSFWLGLENLHMLTSRGHWKLRVELEDWEGEKKYAEYTYFRIGSEKEGYRLYVSGYSGNAGDGMSKYHNGQKFSTFDRDNDEHNSFCAQTYKQAWWYRGCVVAALTGNYYDGGTHEDAHQGVYWRYWKGEKYSYKRAEMKIMPKF